MILQLRIVTKKSAGGGRKNHYTQWTTFYIPNAQKYGLHDELNVQATPHSTGQT